MSDLRIFDRKANYLIGNFCAKVIAIKPTILVTLEKREILTPIIPTPSSVMFESSKVSCEPTEIRKDRTDYRGDTDQPNRTTHNRGLASYRIGKPKETLQAEIIVIPT